MLRRCLRMPINKWGSSREDKERSSNTWRVVKRNTRWTCDVVDSCCFIDAYSQLIICQSFCQLFVQLQRYNAGLSLEDCKANVAETLLSEESNFVKMKGATLSEDRLYGQP